MIKEKCYLRYPCHFAKTDYNYQNWKHLRRYYDEKN